LRDIVHERLQAREVYLGKGFFFGKNRGGNIELLREMSKRLGFFADEVPEVRLRGTRISFSKIRQLLADGKSISRAECSVARTASKDRSFTGCSAGARSVSDRQPAPAQPRHSEIRRLRDRDFDRRQMAAQHHECRHSPDVRR
jgi:hypothetical protein